MPSEAPLPTREGVCIHGGLRRQCETCDLADRLEAVTKERDAWKRLAEARHRHSLELIRGDTFENTRNTTLPEVLAAEDALEALNPPRRSHAN